MDDEDTVNPPNVIEEVEHVEAEETQEPGVPEPIKGQQQETSVPLSALQKERRKRQEMEIENRLLREQQMHRPAPVAEEQPDDRYESATREDLSKLKRDTIREFQESNWMQMYPERYEKVNELLPEFLKRRPNLASAISGASNRYEEAWELMDKLTPKEQQKIKAASTPKKDAPGSPNSVPKGAALNQTIDVMSMNDAEFASWRQQQKRNR